MACCLNISGLQLRFVLIHLSVCIPCISPFMQPTMLNPEAIIAVVSLLVMCVPGAWFAIRVLGPRFTQWWTRRGHPNEAFQHLPLHHPIPIALEPTVLRSSSYPGRLYTMRMSSSYSFVSIILLFIPILDMCSDVNACYHPSRTE